MNMLNVWAWRGSQRLAPRNNNLFIPTICYNTFVATHGKKTHQKNHFRLPFVGFLIALWRNQNDTLMHLLTHGFVVDKLQQMIGRMDDILLYFLLVVDVSIVRSASTLHGLFSTLDSHNPTKHMPNQSQDESHHIFNLGRLSRPLVGWDLHASQLLS